MEIRLTDFGITSEKVLYIDSIPELGGPNLYGTVTYTLKRVVPFSDTSFYPIQHMFSGSGDAGGSDKFNSDVSRSEVPTAITLRQVGLNVNEMSWIVPGYCGRAVPGNHDLCHPASARSIASIELNQGSKPNRLFIRGPVKSALIF